VKTGNT
jgi:hypothetical protein